MLELFREIRDYIQARLVYSALRVLYIFYLKGKFVVITKNLTDYVYGGGKAYPKGTVFFCKAMNSFSSCWDGYSSIFVFFDLKSNSPITLDLTPGQDCKIIPYNELTSVLYGYIK